jgi:hypothetical protein
MSSGQSCGIHASHDRRHDRVLGRSGGSPKVTMHVHEVRPRKDKRGFDLISDALPFGGLWYGEPDAISNAVGSVKFYSRPALLAFPL